MKSDRCRRGHFYTAKTTRHETITNFATGKRYEVRRCRICQSANVQDWMKRNGKTWRDYPQNRKTPRRPRGAG